MTARPEVPMLRPLPRLAPWLLCALASACSGAASGGNPDGSSPGGDAMIVDASMMTTQDAGPPGPDSFPSTSPWYQDVSSAAVSSDSTTIISHLSSAPWGSLKIDVSFAILHADASVARRAYTTTNSAYFVPDCDLAPVPIPPGGAVENYPLMGYTCGGGDCHLLVYQGTRLYELGVANIAGGMFDGSPFTGGCLAIWDLTKDVWAPGTSPYARGEQCTSADAAGFPMAPLILTAADLQSGEIKHALRFTLSNSLIRANSYVHPATHGTGSGGGASGGADTMPYGSRLRLKPGTYAGVTSAQGKLIVQALQKYGMFMADGGSLFISGTADLMGVVGPSDVTSLTASDFEVLDSGAPITWNGNCVRTQITN
jgi:serine/threonine-protein kinase